MDFFKAIWSWIQFNSNGLSILLSLIGFAIVWLQLRKTRDAAEAAKHATDKALRAISDTDTISDLATIRERVKKLQEALRGSRYEISLHETQSLRENLHQLRNRRGFEANERKIQIQGMVTFLRKLQDHLERNLEDSTHQVPVPSFNANLSDYATTISEWMEQMRFTLGGTS